MTLLCSKGAWRLGTRLAYLYNRKIYNSEIEGSGVSVGGLTASGTIMSMISSTFAFVRVLEANLEYYRQAQ